MCRGAPPSRRRAAAAHYTNTCLLPPVWHLDSLEDSRLRHRVLEARRAAPPSAWVARSQERKEAEEGCREGSLQWRSRVGSLIYSTILDPTMLI
jgi:hypothetical protein